MGAWFLSRLFHAVVVGYACDDDLLDESFTFHDGRLKRAWIRFDDVAAKVEYVYDHTRVRFTQIEDEDDFFVRLKERQFSLKQTLAGLPNVETLVEAKSVQQLHAAALQAFNAEEWPVPMGIGTWDFNAEDKSFVIVAERSVAPLTAEQSKPLPPFAYPVKFLSPGWFSRSVLPLIGDGCILFLETEPKRIVLRVLSDQINQKCRDYIAQYGKQVSHEDRTRPEAVTAHEFDLDYSGKHELKMGATSATIALEGGLSVKIAPQGLLRNRVIEFLISGGKTFAHKDWK